MTHDVDLRPSDSLPDQLDRWVQLELISADQARRILSAEQQATAPPAGTAPALRRVVSPVAEALGYVGGVLLVVAAVTITGQYWAALSVTGRVAVALGAAVLLLACGIAVPQAADAGRRLRGVSWVLSVVSLAFGIGLLGADVLDLRAENVTLLAGGVAAGYAAALWWGHRGVLQQAVLLGALALTAGSAAALLPGGDETVVGLALWGVGLVWLLLGWGGLVRPWSAVYICGGLAILVGAQLMVQIGWGSWLAMATVSGWSRRASCCATWC